MNHILELEIKWGLRDTTIIQPWGVETASFICEESTCEDCEFRFSCYTTADTVIELERKFSDYHTAMKYKARLRKRFPRSRVYD